MARIGLAANQRCVAVRASFGLERPSVSVQHSRALLSPRTPCDCGLIHSTAPPILPPTASWRRGRVQVCCDETHPARLLSVLVAHLWYIPTLEFACSAGAPVTKPSAAASPPHMAWYMGPGGIALPMARCALLRLHAYIIDIGWPG